VRDENEALRLANDCVYGLAANVWTKDNDKAVRLAKRIEAGAVCVNDSAITYGVAEAPFGGRKASGVGQVNGDAGLKSYCFAQTIVIDRFGIREEQMWYPYTGEKVKILQKIMKWVWGTPLGRMMT
jgi:succinate-semialdehyde dehydrogenase/glutarate-semialdehyde dehydrogenase